MVTVASSLVLTFYLAFVSAVVSVHSLSVAIFPIIFLMLADFFVFLPPDRTPIVPAPRPERLTSLAMCGCSGAERVCWSS
jgi:hypothetical protein